MFPRFSLRLISLWLKLRQSVEPDGEFWADPNNPVYSVYVLRSLRNQKRYVGYTAKTPLEKLREHNNGTTRWTRLNRPFVLAHYEQFLDSKVARRRERYLKSGVGREWLDKVLNQKEKSGSLTKSTIY